MNLRVALHDASVVPQPEVPSRPDGCQGPARTVGEPRPAGVWDSGGDRGGGTGTTHPPPQFTHSHTRPAPQCRGMFGRNGSGLAGGVASGTPAATPISTLLTVMPRVTSMVLAGV